MRSTGLVQVLGTAVLAIGAALTVSNVANAAGNPSPTGTGQPTQSCGSDSAPNTPGNSASASGSAFNPNGTAGTQYAGQQPQNSNNSHSVSQYDVACYQTSQTR
jgi:hypothetical protein